MNKVIFPFLKKGDISLNFCSLCFIAHLLNFVYECIVAHLRSLVLSSTTHETQRDPPSEFSGETHTYRTITLFKKLEYKCPHDYFQGIYHPCLSSKNTTHFRKENLKI